MQKIPLMLAKSGMVLARDVFRGNSPMGIPICGKGTVLTDSLVARLDNMDVQSIYVEGHPVWEEGGQSLDEMLADLDRRFSKVRSNPHMEKLYDIYKNYLTRSMGGDGGRQAE